MVKDLPAVWGSQVQSLGLADPLEKEMQPTPVFLPEESHEQGNLVDDGPWSHKESDVTEQLTQCLLLGFPGGSEGESACNAGDLGSIPWSGKPPWRRKWLPTPAFLPGESKDGGVHGVAESQT